MFYEKSKFSIASDKLFRYTSDKARRQNFSGSLEILSALEAGLKGSDSRSVGKFAGDPLRSFSLTRVKAWEGRTEARADSSTGSMSPKSNRPATQSNGKDFRSRREGTIIMRAPKPMPVSSETIRDLIRRGQISQSSGESLMLLIKEPT